MVSHAGSDVSQVGRKAGPLGSDLREQDPQQLLGKGTDLGITCVLLPSNTPGVQLGKRHDPLGVPFYNCPTRGKDVVIPAEESIIGGFEGIRPVPESRNGLPQRLTFRKSRISEHMT